MSARVRMMVDVRRPHATRGRTATVYTTGEPAQVLEALARALRADVSRCWFRLAPEGGRGRFRLEAAVGVDPVRYWARSPVLEGTRPRVPVPACPDALMLPRTFLHTLTRQDRVWRLAAVGTEAPQ